MKMSGKMQKKQSKGDFPYFEIAGGPQERGVSYGRQAKPLIERSIGMYLSAFNLGDDAALRKRVGPIRERIGSYFPKLLEELDGIAKGAEVAPDHIVALNARTETLIGQNWDWLPAAADTAIVLRIKSSDGPEIITFVEAGMLARNGMNSAGLGLCGNYIQTDSDFKQPGMPVPVLRRAILEQTNLRDAVAIVEKTPRAMSANHLLAHRDGTGADLEATPGEVFVIPPVDGRLFHANHIQSSKPGMEDLSLKRFPDSAAREARVRELLSKPEKLDQQVMISVLKDKDGYPHSICRSTSDVEGQGAIETVAAVVMDLDGGTLRVARGPAIGDFSEYSFGE
jgi:isopenicillin-N N-acyltransferase like protein